MLHGVIHPVVDIKGEQIRIPHPAPAHIGFVCNDQRRRNGVQGLGGGFIVVADGGYNGADLLRRHTQLIQQTERHDGTALGMIRPVDHVADIMHDPGDPGKLRRPLVIAQLCQDHGGNLRHLFHMGEGMLRKPQACQSLIRPADVGHNVRVLLDVFVCDNGCHAYSFTPFSKYTPYHTRNMNTVQIFRLLSAFPAR